MVVIMSESRNFVWMNQIHSLVLCGEGALTSAYLVAPSNEQEELETH